MLITYNHIYVYTRMLGPQKTLKHKLM